MTSRRNEAFRQAFRRLPEPVQEQARRAFELFKQDRQHKSLRFKRVHSAKEIYSVRIGSGYRALAYRENEAMIWFWIGSHADYEKLISR